MHREHPKTGLLVAEMRNTQFLPLRANPLKGRKRGAGSEDRGRGRQVRYAASTRTGAACRFGATKTSKMSARTTATAATVRPMPA